MKVVWLCHFVNQEMKRHFDNPQLKEMAPWISILIELFHARSDVELHIVAPNIFNNTDCEFMNDGVVYHFYKRFPMPFNSLFFRKSYNILRIDDRSNYFWIKRKIANCIRKIDPDIIHLHGAENPYYSAGILSLFNDYPVLVTVQGFVRNATFNPNLTKTIKIEEEILLRAKNIGVRTEEMRKIVLQLNSKAVLHFHNYPIAYPSIVKENIGKDEPIDCLFFARVCKDKGIEDLLKAISIIKNNYPKISLAIVGSIGSRYLSFLQSLCNELNIVNNIQFVGFLSTQEDVYQYALQSKVCVLPTYHDIIPGTIIESMFLKLPVVTYAVGGIPELNKNEITVITGEKCNINQLAENILLLLNDINKRVILAERAYKYAKHKFGNEFIVNDIVDAYKLILNQNK